MFPRAKLTAMILGLVSALSLAAIAAQQPKPASPPSAARSASSGETLVVEGVVEWLEESDVAALTEGVIKQMEFQVGHRVEQDKPIGSLHDERAVLTVKKAELAAANVGGVRKAEAQRALAISLLARAERLDARGKGLISLDELEKARAEVLVAEAMVVEAAEQQALARADLDLAKRNLEEHTITAPFTGIITERMKDPGEAVHANDPVVRMGKLDKMKCWGYLPLESAGRLRAGDLVDVQPTIDNVDLPIEQKRFRGKILDISKELQTVNRAEVRVIAEIDNPEDPEHPELQLRPGLEVNMTIYLNPDDAPRPVAAAPTAVGARTTRAAVGAR